MNKLKQIIYILGLSFVMILSGCSDPDDEVTSINYDRLFSPTGLKVNVINRTQVRMEWNAVKNADSYTIEVYENADLVFEGTPALTITGVQTIPYVITGLVGETDYSVRFQAVSSDIPGSKWVTFTIATASEQILESVKDDDVTVSSVTLRWPAGEVATTIQIILENNLIITHTLTSDEIAAGEATIAGLQSNTVYKAVLKNGDKTRGTIEFTTKVDLGGATPIYPSDDIVAALNDAEDGEIFVLFPGEYELGEYTATESITIMGYQSSDKPIVKGSIKLSEGSSIILKDLELNGDGSNKNLIDITSSVNLNIISIEGCRIYDYQTSLIYAASSSAIEINKISVTESIISGFGGSGIDTRAALVKQLDITNSTFYNYASGSGHYFIRMDANSSLTGISKTLVENCTLYKSAGATSKGMIYTRFVSNETTMNNNLIVDTQGILADQSATTQPSCSNNNYFNAPNFIRETSSISGVKYDESGSKTTYDPQFADPEKGDFTVGNTDNVFAGDPRWLP